MSPLELPPGHPVRIGDVLLRCPEWTDADDNDKRYADMLAALDSILTGACECARCRP